MFSIHISINLFLMPIYRYIGRLRGLSISKCLRQKRTVDSSTPFFLVLVPYLRTQLRQPEAIWYCGSCFSLDTTHFGKCQNKHHALVHSSTGGNKSRERQTQRFRVTKESYPLVYLPIFGQVAHVPCSDWYAPTNPGKNYLLCKSK